MAPREIQTTSAALAAGSCCCCCWSSQVRKHDLASILLPVVNTKRLPLLASLLCNTLTRTYTTWWSCLPLSLWACRPVLARTPSMQTLLLCPRPLSCKHLLPFVTAKRLVTSNDNSRTSLSSVEAVSPSRLRRRRTRTLDAAHPHPHVVALLLHRCACLH